MLPKTHLNNVFASLHSYRKCTAVSAGRRLGDTGGTSWWASRQLDRQFPRYIYTASMEVTLLPGEVTVVRACNEGAVNLYLHVEILLHHK